MSQLHTELLGKGKKLRKDRVESRGPSKAALSDDQMWIDDCLTLECIASGDDKRVG